MRRLLVALAVAGLAAGVFASVGASAFHPETGWLVRSDVLWTAAAVAGYLGLALLYASFSLALGTLVYVGVRWLRRVLS